MRTKRSFATSVIPSRTTSVCVSALLSQYSSIAWPGNGWAAAKSASSGDLTRKSPKPRRMPTGAADLTPRPLSMNGEGCTVQWDATGPAPPCLELGTGLVRNTDNSASTKNKCQQPRDQQAHGILTREETAMPTPGIVGHAQVTKTKRVIARGLRQSATTAETLAWAFLKDRRLLGLKFRRQQAIQGFIVDFYCPALRLAIELDGGVHESQIDYDQARDRVLTAAGIRVIRLRNEEVSHAALVSAVAPFQP